MVKASRPKLTQRIQLRNVGGRETPIVLRCQFMPQRRQDTWIGRRSTELTRLACASLLVRVTVLAVSKRDMLRQINRHDLHFGCACIRIDRHNVLVLPGTNLQLDPVGVVA